MYWRRSSAPGVRFAVAPATSWSDTKETASGPMRSTQGCNRRIMSSLCSSETAGRTRTRSASSIGGTSDVVVGGRVVVVVVAVVRARQCASHVAFAGGSHSSPLPESTTPSPHVDRMARKVALPTRRALRVAARLSHDGPMAPDSLKATCRPGQFLSDALKDVPFLVDLGFARPLQPPTETVTWRGPSEAILTTSRGRGSFLVTTGEPAGT